MWKSIKHNLVSSNVLLEVPIRTFGGLSGKLIPIFCCSLIQLKLTGLFAAASVNWALKLGLLVFKAIICKLKMRMVYSPLLELVTNHVINGKTMNLY